MLLIIDVRKLKFPGCATRRCRASFGRKHMRDVHDNSRKLPDIAMCFAGVGVFDDHFPNLTYVIDIDYIFCLQVSLWNYESFDATDLICLSVGSGLWTNPFREKCTQDLRTNPFEEEGYDTILVRLASNVDDSIQDPEVQRMIICDWAEICSRMLIMKLNSSGSRDEDKFYDLGLLDTIYVVRPNQRKTIRYALCGTREKDSSFMARYSPCDLILSSFISFLRMEMVGEIGNGTLIQVQNIKAKKGQNGNFLASNAGASGGSLKPTPGRRAPGGRPASQRRGVQLSTSWDAGAFRHGHGFRGTRF